MQLDIFLHKNKSEKIIPVQESGPNSEISALHDTIKSIVTSI